MKYKVTRIFIVEDAEDSVDALQKSKDWKLCVRAVAEPFAGTGHENIGLRDEEKLENLRKKLIVDINNLIFDFNFFGENIKVIAEPKAKEEMIKIINKGFGVEE